MAGNVVFRSNDRGNSWEVISPDLTTNDKSKQKTSGGTIYQDNTAAEFHCTVLYLAESPVQKGVIWAGTDDGNVQVTLDSGTNWTNVNKNIKGLPEFSWVSKIHASEHDAGTAFVVVDQHRMDDFKPYIFYTTNFGKTWKSISEKLPQDDYVKVVRQDPHNPNVLFAGMEHGIYASWDFGKNWDKINNNLPNVSVRDIKIQARDRDIIVGTHGRGAYVLDDIRPIEELSSVGSEELKLFKVRDAFLWNMYWRIENLGDRTYKAKNPEYGAYINYFIKDSSDKNITAQIVDENGETVATLSDSNAARGVNRIVWDLGYDSATPLKNSVQEGFASSLIRPKVAPGSYKVILKANGIEQTSQINVLADPRIGMSQEDHEKKVKSLLALRDLQTATHKIIDDVVSINSQLKELKLKLSMLNDKKWEALVVNVDNLKKDGESFLDEILKRPPPSMNYRQKPRLREEIRSLMRAIDNTTNPPTVHQNERILSLKGELRDAKSMMSKLKNEIEVINNDSVQLPTIALE